MGAINLSAQKLRDASSLKTIAAAWKECVINRGRVIVPYENVTSFRDQLAETEDKALVDPYIYISSNDKYATEPDIHWASIDNLMIVQDCIFSYCFVTGLPASVPLATTPLGFTRGLNKNGLWDEKAGLYGSKGGYVVYCDGHVTWFDGSRPAKFLKWDQLGYTSDIRETVPTGAIITGCNMGSLCLRPAYRGKRLWLYCTLSVPVATERCFFVSKR
jgi:prepilin-type processing-associated H-X9-DG protein